ASCLPPPGGGLSHMKSKVRRHRHCAPSPACGGGLGWGRFRIGIPCAERPPPAALFERVGLPRKRERRSEPADKPLEHLAIALPSGGGRRSPSTVRRRVEL